MTQRSWSAFGTIPTDEGGAASPLEFLWDDGNVNFISHSRDEITFTDEGLAICELLNRHDTHTQTLMPMDCDGFVVVAPAEVDFSKPEHFEAIRAFVLPHHSVVHLRRGTWHWGPYPVSAQSIRLFNIQGTGYTKDNGIAWLGRDHDTHIEVGL